MTKSIPARRFPARALFPGFALALSLAASAGSAAVQEPAAAAAPAAPTAPQVHREHRILIIEKDGAAKGDETALKTRVIEKDGKTIVIKTNKAVTDAEIEEKVAKALAAMPDAPTESAASGKGERRVIVKRIQGEGAPEAMAWSHADHAESRVTCTEGAKTANFESEATDADGTKRKAVMRFCLAQSGTGGAKAGEGLKAARERISKDPGLSPAIRDDILKQLDAEIERLSKQG